MRIPARCPQCGAPLQIEEQCHISEPYIPSAYVRGRDYGPGGYPHRIKVAPAALCNQCEFAIEIRRER